IRDFHVTGVQTCALPISFDLCLAENSEMTTLMGVMLDCPDAKLLSTFYSDLLGKPVTYEGDGVAMIGGDGDQPVMFQQIQNYQRSEERRVGKGWKARRGQ